MTPFVVYMLVDEHAITDLMGTTMPVALSRLVVVVHNILLFVWIHWAYREASGTSTNRKATSFGASWRESPVFIVALVMLSANVAGFAAIAATPWYHALPDIWAMAYLAVGALIGFVFGVPKWVRPKEGAAKAEHVHPS